MKICFATNNPNKIKEIKTAVGDRFEVLTLSDIGCNEEIPEDQDTISGNSSQKANFIKKHYNIDCFADDTGLEVEALNGEPGVYSARYAGPACDSQDNMKLLLKKLSGIENRNARFVTVITLIIDQKEFQFQGVVEGEIRTELSGNEGFGYDPIFSPNGYDITFAEMDLIEKNRISHRGKAVSKLVDFLKNQNL